MSTSRTLAPSNISRIVNLWLNLVPDCLRSTADDAASSGYEQVKVLSLVYFFNHLTSQHFCSEDENVETQNRHVFDLFFNQIS